MAKLAAVGLLAGCVLAGSACSKHEPPVAVVLEAGGVSVKRVRDVELGATDKRRGRVGDWVMVSKGISFVVGRADQSDRDSRSGAIVDLSTGTLARHPLQQIRTAIQIEGAPVTLRTTGVRPVATSPTPRLRVSQVVLGYALSVETDLQIDASGAGVEAVTRLRNSGSQPIRMVQLGDSVAWPGGVPFAPRIGEVLGPTAARLPWFARRGETLCFALAFPDVSADVEFKFDENGPIAQLALAPPIDVLPGASAHYRRFVIVADRGLGPVAELAWRRTGHAVGRVQGTLRPPPAWARIRALDPNGRTIMEVDSDAHGDYDLPLPEGRYRLVLKASGGSDEQEVSVEPPASVRGELLPPLPGRLHLSATDSNGAALPVRWVVRGIPPTQDPAFGPEEHVIGSGDVIYTGSGQGSVEIRPGHYRVLATHGPEYSVDEQAVRIGVSEGALVRAMLERAVNTEGWIAADLHLHAAPSFDSVVSLEDRVVSAAAEGLDFVVSTDHNVVSDYRPAIKRMQLSSRLATASGVEVTTEDWGHLNVFPYPLDIPPPPAAGMTPAQEFQYIRQHAPNALIQVNHPMFERVGYFNLGGLTPGKAGFKKPGFSLKFDVLEVLNGFELHDALAVRRNLATWFSLLNDGLRYAATGNSDSHRLSGQFAGYARTYVRVRDDDPRRVPPEELFDSLRAGHATVSNGPFVSVLVNGEAGPGDELSVDGGEVTLEISVRAPDWVDVQRAEVWANGVRIATQYANDTTREALARIEWQLPLKLDRDAWFVVVADGNDLLDRVLPGRGALPIGFTNPVYVDVDGNGKFDASRPELPAAKEEGPDPHVAQ